MIPSLKLAIFFQWDIVRVKSDNLGDDGEQSAFKRCSFPQAAALTGRMANPGS